MANHVFPAKSFSTIGAVFFFDAPGRGKQLPGEWGMSPSPAGTK